jgi:hypothetical protein
LLLQVSSLFLVQILDSTVFPYSLEVGLLERNLIGLPLKELVCELFLLRGFVEQLVYFLQKGLLSRILAERRGSLQRREVGCLELFFCI